MGTTSIRPYLELQAARLEALAGAHRLPMRVTGGIAGPRVIEFHITTTPGVRFNSLKALEPDMARALRVDSVMLSIGDKGMLCLCFENPNVTQVRLKDLLQKRSALPECTALLGINTKNAPLLARLTAPTVAHVLLAGTTGSGKSVLLRSIVVSLLVTNSIRQVQVVIIDPKGRTFPPLAQHRGVVRQVHDPEEATQVIASLVALMEERDAQHVSTPHIVVAIDELADLIMVGAGVERPLIRLAQRGREAGIHLVAATQRPSAAVLSGLMRANFPLRLVGRVVSGEDSRIAAGQKGVQANLLGGAGDFYAVSAHGVTRFQAAFVSHAEAAEMLSANVRYDPQVLQDLLPWAEGVGESAPEGAEPVMLPPVIDVAADTDGLDELVERLRPWWLEHRNEWGSKTKAVKLLFGDETAPGGYPWQSTQAAIARIEEEISSSSA